MAFALSPPGVKRTDNACRWLRLMSDAPEGIAAVRGVRVKLRDKTVRVGFDADHIGIGQLKEEMNRAGFQVVLAGL